MKTLGSLALILLCVGCGARTGALVVDEDTPRLDAGRRDAGTDALVPPPEAGIDGGADAGTDGGADAGCVPVDDACLSEERCGDGTNDDCDGRVDEGCPCAPGSVQSCFLGPPGRRDVGACQDGSQVCEASAAWGPCTGGVLPDGDVCTGRDDLCDGCSDERVCMIDCPSPGDPRVPVGHPFEEYALNGRDFYVGPARAWQWRIEGGPCDGLAPRLESFELRRPRRETAVFVPKLSGEYRVTLEVTTPSGERLSCSWVVDVTGPGLRIEMCYPESETLDLDLFLHRPDDTRPWYTGFPRDSFSANPDASCGWHTCEAEIRQLDHPRTGAPNVRPDWGYADSPLEACVNGPQGAEWRRRGSCANPRLDIDNNLSEGIGLPENINVDHPRDGQSFRVMVQNFSGVSAHPVVNVYCAGRRVATYGQAPDTLARFEGARGDFNYGAMWHVADVRVRVDASGETVGCEVTSLHPEGAASGYRITYNDPRY